MATSNTAASTIGSRIRRSRRTKKMSQATLAAHVDRSESWMRGIEAGRIKLDKHSVIDRLADVLEVDVAWLLGQPCELTQDTRHRAVPALRAALRRTSLSLSGHAGLRAVTPQPLLTDLRDDVDRITRRRQAANLFEVMRQLPDLTEALNTGALLASGTERDVIDGLIIETSHVARTVLNQLGYHDLAWTAVENAATAAARLGDPLMSACSAWDRCGVLLHTDTLDEALTVAEAALSELQDLMTSPTPQVLSLWGALHLRCAVASARLHDGSTAWAYLAEAEAAAARLGMDRNDFQTVFGPTNCGIHATEIAVALDRPDIALKHHTSINLAGLMSKERHTRHRIEVARAQGRLKHDAAAVEQLERAICLAPQYVYNHPTVRDLVDELSRRAQPSAVDAGLGAIERAMRLA
ncbi:helix-turn-helix domain-containing protein [Nocardia suismassiliense]|uniref:helix-turn-helix domain-containing protein n=1 Tax=Nocardia suismassiliense TaxID=2077092 RepID=UPI00131F0658|nr:helix-turn-helix transcriptional regulator [Nocardia suismassiliense]